MNHKIIRTLLALLFVSLLIAVPRAQQPTAVAKPPAEDRVALYQALLDLTNPWTVMCIAAHPDDEDGTSLIVMRRKFGAHTVSLFSTFGEGGQNAIGPELYEQLGAIRARETKAAAEIQGSEPYFLGLKDFGYSKSADETFQKWGHDEALRRMVLQIRKLRPDVIITNHSVTNNDHGHHQATARLVLEAFDAAADPKRFPEQLKDGVTVWQVQRLFVRAPRNVAPNPGQKPDREGGRNDLVTIDPNERDPIRDTTFAEEALRALQKHATQGPWPKTFAEFAARFRSFTGQGAAPGQLPLIRYVLVREAKDSAALAKESHNFLEGLRLPEDIAKRIAVPTVNDQPLTALVDQPKALFSALVPLHKRLMGGWSGAEIQTEVSDGATRRVKRLLSEVNGAIALSAGVSSKLILRDQVLVPGQLAHFSFIISNKGDAEVHLKLPFERMSQSKDLAMLCCADFPRDLTVPPGKTIDVPVTSLTPANAEPSVPRAEHLYDENQSRMAIAIGPLTDISSTLVSVLAVTFADVAPAVEIAEVAPSPAILTPATIPDRPSDNDSAKRLRFTIKLINHQLTPFDGNLIAASGITHERTDRVAVRLAAGESKTVTLLAQEPPDLGPHSPVAFMIQSANVHSPSQTVPVIYADARVAPKVRVGYVRGFDYSLPNALSALGVESKELSIDEVKATDLSKYASIIVDNRVYESQPELIVANQKLLDYANAGGTLIVFYHKSFEWNPDERRKRPQLAPYKLILGDERITDENAPVTFIEPQHPLLNFPNKIGQEDFAGWIQERGLYYPKEWDAQYHALLQSNDPGEPPLKGGLLVADYGRGHYIYSSMVWYRQLRAGVPGAYRMLANMISYGQAK